MFKKPKRLILLLSIILLKSLNLYSQQAELSDNGDTLICFSVNQSKFLLKQVIALNECDSLLHISENQLTYCDSVFQTNKTIEKVMFEMIRKHKDIELLKEGRIEVLNTALKEEVENTRVESNKKRLWIGATAFVSSIFCYYILTTN